VAQASPGILNYFHFFLWSHSALFNVLAYNYHAKLGFSHNDQHERDILTLQRSYSLRDITSTVHRAKEIAQRFDTIILVAPSRLLWIGKNRDVEDRIHRDFVRLLGEEHLFVIDLRPYFEQTGHPMNYYFKHDGHWNADGNRLVAEGIANYLRKVNIAPRRLSLNKIFSSYFIKFFLVIIFQYLLDFGNLTPDALGDDILAISSEALKLRRIRAGSVLKEQQLSLKVSINVVWVNQKI
jgi:hypothetical protein